MKQPQQCLGIITREGTGSVTLCPALDVASQGMTVEEARQNLIEAITLFCETRHVQLLISNEPVKLQGLPP